MQKFGALIAPHTHMHSTFASEACGEDMKTSEGSADVLVGLDFGTTFSGYAYCRKNDPDKIFMFYEWPDQSKGGGQPYCKTQTSLFYAPDEQGTLQFKSWGWPALVQYREAVMRSGRDHHYKVGHLVTLFKLNLADCDHNRRILPAGLTTKIVITDYLREISKSIAAELKNKYGTRLSMRDVQWRLTVPTLWDDHAKQCMKVYAEEAGLVGGENNPSSSSEASCHPLEIVLEPEAAAVYCLSKLKNQTLAMIKENDMFLTADIGGGTVDIVVHKKLNNKSNNLQLEEVIRSTGDLCGGSFVDERFMAHMCTGISCLAEFLKENPMMELTMRRWWGETKSTFDGMNTAIFQVPAKLCRAWEEYDKNLARVSTLVMDREEVELTASDMREIFDPVVEEIIQLIADALARKEVFGKVKLIVVVGGFAASPYLMAKLREKFTIVGRREVVSPPDPGSAVCQGAAMLGSRIGHSSVIVSRVCRKTYGVSVMREFKRGDSARFKLKDDEGTPLCENVFDTFVRNGDSIPVDFSVTKEYFPCNKSEREMEISVFSTNQRMVKYVTDEGVKKEHNLMLDISAGMHVNRKIEVTMCFGGTSISVKAKGVNFDAHGAAKQAIPLVFVDKEEESLVMKEEDVQHVQVPKRKRELDAHCPVQSPISSRPVQTASGGQRFVNTKKQSKSTRLRPQQPTIRQ